MMPFMPCLVLQVPLVSLHEPQDCLAGPRQPQSSNNRLHGVAERAAARVRIVKALQS